MSTDWGKLGKDIDTKYYLLFKREYLKDFFLVQKSLLKKISIPFLWRVTNFRFKECHLLYIGTYTLIRHASRLCVQKYLLKHYFKPVKKKKIKCPMIEVTKANCYVSCKQQWIEEKWRAKEKRKYIPIWMQSSKE